MNAVGPDIRAALVTTGFVSSWLGRARPGDLHDPDPTRRAAAWAHWAFESLAPMTGSANRPYTALMLPGSFYDPKGSGTKGTPHLEIPAHLFERADVMFPDRLAQAGNGLLFPWWLVPETLAVKRAVFAVPKNNPAELVDLLNERRVGLRDALISTTRIAGEVWDRVEEKMVTDPELMSHLVTTDFTADDVANYWPAGADLNLHVEFDRKLRDSQKQWVARRVGVWRIVGANDHGEFVLGTVAPRLTRSSTFADPLFTPGTESPAANLVRSLVLRRVANHFTRTDTVVADPTPERKHPPGLRAVVARVGEKLPEASVGAAVKFLHAYPDAHDAWDALETWARGRGDGTNGGQHHAFLTVTEEGFVAAHKAAWRAIRRAEEPERDDINVILPLAWDANSRVVRITFAPRPNRP